MLVRGRFLLSPDTIPRNRPNAINADRLMKS